MEVNLGHAASSSSLRAGVLGHTDKGLPPERLASPEGRHSRALEKRSVWWCSFNFVVQFYLLRDSPIPGTHKLSETASNHAKMKGLFLADAVEEGSEFCIGGTQDSPGSML